MEEQYNYNERLMKMQEQQALRGRVKDDYEAMELREQERGLLRDQLSLTEEIESIENLLRGKILSKDSNGKPFWKNPPSEDMEILTEYGVHLIMNTIMFYMNKNTLLSNYEEEVILNKMEDFATDLSDTIFMEYEKIFKYPTFNECKKILMDRIEKKSELRKFALNLIGKDADIEDLKKEFIMQIESKIEEEMDVIRDQVIKDKLKRFLILIREVQDSVHSTYLRAWKGQERRTLRQHIMVSENVGVSNTIEKKKGLFG